MKETRIAYRYAKSFLTLALEHGEIDKAYIDMKNISEVCRQSKKLSLLLKSPIVKPDKKTDILREIFSTRLGKLSLSFIDIIIKKRRENYLEAIAGEFQNQYKSHKNILTAIVTSAVGLDDKIRSEIIRIVRESSNAEVELVEKEDKELIGGFILRVGDKQVDASIQRKLLNLRRDFKN